MKLNTDNWELVEAQSRAALPEPIVRYIEQCLTRPHSESQLISVLHKVQGHFGHLGREQMDAVAQLMHIPTAKVTGVATFYHFFRTTPVGRHTLRLCLGTACHVRGVDLVLKAIREELGVGLGETSADGVFTVEGVRCLGACGLAPVMMVDEEVYGKLDAKRTKRILRGFRDATG